MTSTHLVSVAEVAAALLAIAFEYWLEEVEVDALLHLEGTAVVQAGKEASLEVEQGQHVLEISLCGQLRLSSVHQGQRFHICLTVQ